MSSKEIVQNICRMFIFSAGVLNMSWGHLFTGAWFIIIPTLILLCLDQKDN